MITSYKGMKVFASLDKTQCGLEHGMEEGFFITSEMEREWDSPVLIQGPTSILETSVGKDKELSELYEEIKDENYFMVIKNVEYE